MTGTPISRQQANMVTTKEAATTAVSDASGNHEDHEVNTTSWWRHVLGYVWDSAEGEPRDRKFVQKLDAYMFTTVILGYFIKYLDQTNMSNAFVSGMKKDLALYGNERNWLNTWFSLGVMVGSLPAMMFQLRWIRPSIFIPCCELIWSALVMSMAAAKNVETLYALRFFIGLFESCAFPGYVALLSGWYGPKELTKRVAILLEVESIASMFSGYLQAGLYTSMNGRHGLAGWRWLFIMDGVISIPIAFWGFFGLPDLPHTTRAFYLSSDDKNYAIERIERIGQPAPVKLTRTVLKNVFLNWKIWAFVFPYVMVAACHTATSYFNLWLSAIGYSVVKVNTLPTIGNAIAIVTVIACGIIADRTGKRFMMINALVLLMILSNILLSVWHIPKGALMFAYYLSYTGSATTPILIAWGAELNANDPNLRQLLVATANIVSYAWVLWVPLVLFPTYDAPKYAYGYQILILFGGLAIMGICLMTYLYKREAKILSQKRVDSDADRITSSSSSSNQQKLGEESPSA